MKASPRIELHLCHIYLMIDLLVQHPLNRIVDYIEINHRMQTASSTQDRISAQLISSQSVEYSFNYAYSVFSHLF